MTEEEKRLMKQYRITSEQQTMYFYNWHKHDKLKDAISYAKIDTRHK